MGCVRRVHSGHQLSQSARVAIYRAYVLEYILRLKSRMGASFYPKHKIYICVGTCGFAGVPAWATVGAVEKRFQALS